MAVRAFLGLCEGGMMPGVTFYLSTYYKRHELVLRVGIFGALCSGHFHLRLGTYSNSVRVFYEWRVWRFTCVWITANPSIKGPVSLGCSFFNLGTLKPVGVGQ